MLGLLPRDAVREDAPFAVDERRRGFVAARFEAEDKRHIVAPIPARRGGGQAAVSEEIRAETAEHAEKKER
jgi:hypothetical protein